MNKRQTFIALAILIVVSAIISCCSTTNYNRNTIVVKKYGPIYQVTTTKRTVKGFEITKQYYDCLPDSLLVYRR